MDFEPRPYHPLSGWPIGKAELDPFAARADTILDIGAPLLPDAPVAGGDGDFRRIGWRRSSPATRFGLKYEAQLTASPRIALCLNANLVDLRLDDTLSTVTGAVFKSFAPGDPGFTVRARCYALALGGLENPRMLLNFTSQIPQGIGNRNGLVGRHFHDHVVVEVADVLLARPIKERDLSYAPTPAFQDAHGMLSMAFQVTQRPPRELPLYHQLARTAECATPFVQRLVETVLDKELQCRAGGLTELWVQRDPEHYPSGDVWVQTEQPLHAESRVSLNEQTDAFGLRRLTLDWRIDDGYFASLREATVALGGVVAEEGVGRLRVRPWLLASRPEMPTLADNVGDLSGYHHMGTTRMAADPARGVVDADCRVHGTTNLYIGGSSVFPTGGFANPTYTIVQLSLRLGDHLGQALHS